MKRIQTSLTFSQTPLVSKLWTVHPLKLQLFWLKSLETIQWAMSHSSNEPDPNSGGTRAPQTDGKMITTCLFSFVGVARGEEVLYRFEAHRCVQTLTNGHWMGPQLCCSGGEQLLLREQWDLSIISQVVLWKVKVILNGFPLMGFSTPFSQFW